MGAALPLHDDALKGRRERPRPGTAGRRYPRGSFAGDIHSGQLRAPMFFQLWKYELG